jgi:1-acyl-sn-glycerol-3-phosphate acyltransferase
MFSPTTTDRLAILLLAGLTLGLVAWLVHAFHHERYRSWLEYGLHIFGRWMCRIVWRLSVEGEWPVSPGQSAVVVCNHIGPIDPAFIAIAARRTVHWFVAREYYEQWGVRWFFRSLGCISTNRAGVDTAATRFAIRCAGAGDLVGMFPEGRINTTRRLLLPGRPGAALVAIKARSPIVPCFLAGSPNGGATYDVLFVSARTRLRIGSLIDVGPYLDQPDERAAADELTLRLLRDIAALGGHPNWEAEIANRRWKPGMEEDADAAA